MLSHNFHQHGTQFFKEMNFQKQTPPKQKERDSKRKKLPISLSPPTKETKKKDIIGNTARIDQIDLFQMHRLESLLTNLFICSDSQAS